MRTILMTLGLVLVVGQWSAPCAQAALTPEQRKELTKIRADITRVSTTTSNKKDLEEGDKALQEAEEALRKIVKEAGIKESDVAVASIFTSLNLKKGAMEKRRGPVPVSFCKDVAPILTARCLGCHGERDPKGGLSLYTFAGMKRGGITSNLFVIGDPSKSLLVQKISTTGRGKMPPNGNPLEPAEIAKISNWIAQGAKFDGSDDKIKIGPGPKLDAEPANPTVAITKATGNETVSFTRDIAPFMVNLCLNCHSGNTPRAGFSLETFEQLMRGGRSGRVVLPGNIEDSRMWHLVGKQDPIKMPPGQALITRSNHRNLRIWIEEGAKYDGGDPKKKLRALVPTESEKRAEAFAKLSSEEALKLRRDATVEAWKKALSMETPNVVETNEFLFYGTAAEGRLKQLADWADSDAKAIRKMFNVREPLVWKGKLTIFVFKDRFGYSEFTQTNERLEAPPEQMGHARVSSAGDEAYLCLFDIGDDSTDKSPGMQLLLTDLLTSAYLSKSENKPPVFIQKGLGLVLAGKSSAKSSYLTGLPPRAAEVFNSLAKPTDLFVDGTFAGPDGSAVAYTLCSHMMKVGGENQFMKFLTALQNGSKLETALKDVYGADTAKVALSFSQSLPQKKGPLTPKKK